MEYLNYHWPFWARKEQLPPEGRNWTVWLLLSGRGFGKDLDVSTPILTPDRGFVPLGDLETGDYVYDADGQPTKVIDTYSPLPRQLVEFTFSDGTTLVSSVEHEWETQTRKERKRNTSSVKTTQEIIDTFTHGSREDLNHSIPLCKPVTGGKTPDGIDCYYLGYWLGDGISKAAHQMSVGKQDREFFKSLYPEFVFDKGSNILACLAGTKPFIYNLGLFNNKHLPEQVLTYSFEDRLELLKGLMDSDGYACKSQVEFCSIKKELAEGVLLLARSLGQKPRLYVGDARIDGRSISKKYRVCWKPSNESLNPFKNPRKANKLQFKGLSQQQRNKQRMIVSFKFVDYRPTKCISVDNKRRLFLAGEGLIPTHNTRTGAETVRSLVCGDTPLTAGRYHRIGLIAETAADARQVMIEGESGLLPCHPKDFRPHYQPSTRTITWPNGAVATIYNATEPDQLRGPQFDLVWADELAKWKQAQETWDNIQMCLRLGNDPKAIVTTTPRPIPLIKELVKDKHVVVTSGSTFDNKANLADPFLRKMKQKYEGTRLGRQELEGEILMDIPGALWRREDIDGNRIEEAPQDLERVIVAVDPATSNEENSDETGIVVVGIARDSDGYAKGYLLEDGTISGSPEEWSKQAIRLYRKWSADRIVAEKNQGGDMVASVLRIEDKSVPITLVHASRGKVVRAEPISALYEQGKVHHVGQFNELEDQMCLFSHDTMLDRNFGSPDRVDALVWGFTYLLKSFHGKKAGRVASNDYSVEPVNEYTSGLTYNDNYSNSRNSWMGI